MKKIKSIILLIIILLVFSCGTIFAANNVKQIKAEYLKLGNTSYGGGYLFGEIISEKKPNIVFKSTDGAIKKEVYIEDRGNNRYYFDRHLVEIDFSKKYVFEVTDNKRTYNLNIGIDRKIGTHVDYSIEVKENEISIKDYIPKINLNSLNVGKTGYGGAYIYGELEAEQFPKITFKSTDGKIEKDVYVKRIEDKKYYFDRHLVEIDFDKQYLFQVSIGKSTQKISLGANRELGTIVNTSVSINNNAIIVKEYQYIGIPYVKTINFDLGTTQSGSKYIYGKIEYYEKENGVLKISKVPPKIIFKSTDGTEEKDVYINKLDEKTYYFDRHIVELNMDKQYIFEVSSGDKTNKTTEKTYIALENRDLGINKNSYEIYTEANKVKFVFELYSRDFYAQIKTFNISLTDWKSSYLYGILEYKEFDNGIEKNTEFNPIIEFKSVDGLETHEVYVEKKGNEYYFDRHLVELNSNKKYIFEIKSGDLRNSSNSMILDFSKLNKKYNTYQYNVNINNNEFEIKSKSYFGNLNAGLKKIATNKNNNGGYLYGNINCYEVIDGEKRSILFNPKIELVATDNSVSYNCYVNKVGTNERL